MKVVRTFHPVGQGAFYSERFYQEGEPEAEFNLVYDCGTSWGSVGKAKQVVEASFDKKDKIDYLFISHLDYDHISLVKTLLSSVRLIKKIVLPLVSLDELLVAIAFNQIANHQDSVEFLQKIISHLNGIPAEDYFLGDYQLVFVGDLQEQQIREGVEVLPNGRVLQFYDQLDWVLIPYSIDQRNRCRVLITKLDTLFKGKKFVGELRQSGYGAITTGQALYNQLKDSAFVARVLNNKVLKNGIKKAYEDIQGGINENSLLVYSGPLNTEREYRLEVCSPHLLRFSMRAGCLYTGDCTCNVDGWRGTHYSFVWQSIGTIQLPHHGSIKSFDVNTNHFDRPYIVPVSCGSENKYGHPSGKVLAFLMAHDCYSPVITELSNTVFIERIECN